VKDRYDERGCITPQTILANILNGRKSVTIDEVFKYINDIKRHFKKDGISCHISFGSVDVDISLSQTNAIYRIQGFDNEFFNGGDDAVSELLKEQNGEHSLQVENILTECAKKYHKSKRRNMEETQQLGFKFTDDGKDCGAYQVGRHFERAVIPAKHEGIPVSQILSLGFAQNKDLRSIFIPRSVTIIGRQAFQGCENLESVEFEKGSSLFIIQEGAFDGCRSLTEFIIPESVFVIEASAFRGCKNLEKVEYETRPKLVVGQGVFEDCDNLKTNWYPCADELLKMLLGVHRPHEKLCRQLHETYIAKNKDYGGSFDESYKEYGITSSLIRIGDKFNRFKSLVKNQTAEVKDEKLRDTLLDMANYCLLTVLNIDAEAESLEQRKGE
jgi:hypothetical protein